MSTVTINGKRQRGDFVTTLGGKCGFKPRYGKGPGMVLVYVFRSGSIGTADIELFDPDDLKKAAS